MKTFLSLLLCALLFWRPVSGQQLIWQQRYSWPGTDALIDAIALSDGSVLAIGAAGSIPGIAAIRWLPTGDTLYMRGLSLTRGYYRTMRLCSLSTGAVFAAVRSPSQGSLLGKLDIEQGQVEWIQALAGIGPQSYPFNPNHVIEGPNNTIIFAGDCIDPLGQAANVGYLACYDTLGVLQWDTVIREHLTNTFCHHVEMTRDGNILVSGTAGSRIFAAEYAQDGFEIRRATFYQSAGRINFDYNPTVSVRQAPGDRYVVSGQIQSNPRRTYLGMHQGWAGPRLWGFEQPGSLIPVQVNQDGGLVYERVSIQSRLMRLRQDSSVVWTGMLGLLPSQQANMLEGFAWLPDSSVIGVGFARFQGSAAEDWYAARISNMGVPYRPWQPATATKAKASPQAPRPYPSPCTSTLHFAGLVAPATLQLYGTDGRLALSQAVAPGQAVDVSALVAGVYGYRLVAQGKVWRGRVVKR